MPSGQRTAVLDRLSLVVAIGAIGATPLGISAALPAMHHPTWLLWGLGVGICSTVIPYLTDQLAIAWHERLVGAVDVAAVGIWAPGSSGARTIEAT